MKNLYISLFFAIFCTTASAQEVFTQWNFVPPVEEPEKTYTVTPPAKGPGGYAYLHGTPSGAVLYNVSASGTLNWKRALDVGGEGFPVTVIAYKDGWLVTWSHGTITYVTKDKPLKHTGVSQAGQSVVITDIIHVGNTYYAAAQSVYCDEFHGATLLTFTSLDNITASPPFSVFGRKDPLTDKLVFVYKIRTMPDGTLLMTGRDDVEEQTALISLDPKTGHVIEPRLISDIEIKDVAVNGDGQILLVDTYTLLLLRNFHDEEPVVLPSTHREIASAVPFGAGFMVVGTKSDDHTKGFVAFCNEYGMHSKEFINAGNGHLTLRQAIENDSRLVASGISKEDSIYGSFLVNLSFQGFTAIGETLMDPGLVNIYPNPSDGIITVDAPNCTLQVCDMNGKIVRTTDLHSRPIYVDNLDSGAYIFKLVNRDGQSYSKTMIVK